MRHNLVLPIAGLQPLCEQLAGPVVFLQLLFELPPQHPRLGDGRVLVRRFPVQLARAPKVLGGGLVLGPVLSFGKGLDFRKVVEVVFKGREGRREGAKRGRLHARPECLLLAVLLTRSGRSVQGVRLQEEM
jgi:hypothetical protein